MIMTHRDGLPRLSARSVRRGDAGHRKACETPSESLGKPSLWVIIIETWYKTLENKNLRLAISASSFWLLKDFETAPISCLEEVSLWRRDQSNAHRWICGLGAGQNARRSWSGKPVAGGSLGGKISELRPETFTAGGGGRIVLDDPKS